MLQVRDLSFSYQNKPILKNIDFTVNRGEIISLIGSNGSGKSTLLRTIAGLLKPSKGEIRFQDQNVHKRPRKWISQHIAFLPQNLEQVQHITVWELISRGRSPHQDLCWKQSAKDKEKISWVIEYMNLTSLQNRTLQSLSGGEKQRAWIAMILVQDTDLLLLDEPVTYLDMKYQWELLSVIKQIKREYHKSFIIVLHDLQHALNVADRFIAMKDGEIYSVGEPSEGMTSQLIENVFDISASVHQLPEYNVPFIVPTMLH